MGVPKTGYHIQTNIRMPNPSQEPPASSKAPNEDLKDMDVLCTFKIKIGSQNLEHVSIRYQWPYPNQDQYIKPQSGTTSPNKSPKSGLQGFKGHWFSLHLQNQDRAGRNFDSSGYYLLTRVILRYRSSTTFSQFFYSFSYCSFCTMLLHRHFSIFLELALSPLMTLEIHTTRYFRFKIYDGWRQ